jgi:hypothetical protein
MEDESKVEMALVVKSQHDAQNRVYRYSTHEIPAHKAEEQLSKPEEKRNYHFKGARYATDEEAAIYWKEQSKHLIIPKKAKAKPEEDGEDEVAIEVKKSKPTKVKA